MNYLLDLSPASLPSLDSLQYLSLSSAEVLRTGHSTQGVSPVPSTEGQSLPWSWWPHYCWYSQDTTGHLGHLDTQWLMFGPAPPCPSPLGFVPWILLVFLFLLMPFSSQPSFSRDSTWKPLCSRPELNSSTICICLFPCQTQMCKCTLLCLVDWKQIPLGPLQCHFWVWPFGPGQLAVCQSREHPRHNSLAAWNVLSTGFVVGCCQHSAFPTGAVHTLSLWILSYLATPTWTSHCPWGISNLLNIQLSKS